MSRRKTVDDYHQLANRINWQWSGNSLPKKTSDKTNWICNNGHSVYKSYYLVKRNSGACYQCSPTRQKNEADYRVAGIDRGISWVGESVPLRTSDKTMWACSTGHVFETSYICIGNQKTNCPYCSGTATKTIEDYISLSKKTSVVFLDKEIPLDTHTTCNWKCPQCGDTWLTTFQHIASGRRNCLDCGYKNNVQKRSIDLHEVTNIVNVMGYTLIDELADDITTRTKFNAYCPEGHRVYTSYANLTKHQDNDGNRCLQCAVENRANLRRKPSSEYVRLANELGWKWVGPEVNSIDELTNWVCSQGHQVKTTYYRAYINDDCPHCSGRATKSETDYHQLAKDKNNRWIGDAVPNDTRTHTNWECLGCGYIWSASWSSRRVSEHGCPQCSNVSRKTNEDFRFLGESVGIEWIGTDGKQPATKDKTLWRCGNGHEWEASWASVTQYRNGCPHCNGFYNGVRTSSQQREICSWIDGELNYLEGRYYIDVAVFIDEYKICIEYDGWHWHKEQLEYDTKRDEHLIANDWKVLRIKGNDLLPKKDHVLEAIDMLIGGEVYLEIILDDWGEG